MLRLAVVLGFLVAHAFGAAALVAAQEATPAAAPTAPQRTDTRYFLPYGPEGLSPTLTVVAETSGVCAHESLETPGRPDAWDCLGATDNTIYDPCFASPFIAPEDEAELACASAPFADEVVLFRLTGPLPRVKEGQPADGIAPVGAVQEAAVDPWQLPWALELANGERCTLLTGATAVLAGHRVNYGCDGGSVLGEVDRSQPLWTASYLADGAVSTTLVNVVVAWA
jgi:hypothetical protein